MATTTDPVLVNLQAAQANAAARLAELDALPSDQRKAMTYTDGDQTYTYGEYRDSLNRQLAGFGQQIESYLKAAQMIGGPFTVLGRAGR